MFKLRNQEENRFHRMVLLTFRISQDLIQSSDPVLPFQIGFLFQHPQSVKIRKGNRMLRQILFCDTSEGKFQTAALSPGQRYPEIIPLYPFWYGLLLVFFCIPAVIKKFIQFFSDCNHLTHGIMVFRIECQTALPDGLIHIYIHGTEKAADQLLTASQNQHTDPVSHCAWSDGEVIIGGTASGSGFLLFSDFFF